ncbi:MAG: hypothetical protein LBD68_04175 [Zoogloeaceae bacterium]|jgi:hypothetical protein|nr:hypothetical protein [Zoogloeaceae bacterium]
MIFLTRASKNAGNIRWAGLKMWRIGKQLGNIDGILPEAPAASWGAARVVALGLDYTSAFVASWSGYGETKN